MSIDLHRVYSKSIKYFLFGILTVFVLQNVAGSSLSKNQILMAVIYITVVLEAVELITKTCKHDN